MSWVAKGRRVLGDERVGMASLMRHDYDAGASIREIADAFERSYGFTRTLLEETGGLRKRGGSKQVTS